MRNWYLRINLEYSLIWRWKGLGRAMEQWREEITSVAGFIRSAVKLSDVYKGQFNPSLKCNVWCNRSLCTSGLLSWLRALNHLMNLSRAVSLVYIRIVLYSSTTNTNEPKSRVYMPFFSSRALFLSNTFWYFEQWLKACKIDYGPAVSLSY